MEGPVCQSWKLVAIPGSLFTLYLVLFFLSWLVLAYTIMLYTVYPEKKRKGFELVRKGNNILRSRAYLTCCKLDARPMLKKPSSKEIADRMKNLHVLGRKTDLVHTGWQLNLHVLWRKTDILVADLVSFIFVNIPKVILIPCKKKRKKKRITTTLAT